MTDSAEWIDVSAQEVYRECQSCQGKICVGAYGKSAMVMDRGFLTAEGIWVCTPCASRGCVPEVELEPIDISDDVPKEYENASLDDLDIGLANGLRYWPRPNALIVLNGGNGRGKTHALWALQRLIAFKGHKVTYHDTRSLRTKWASCFPEKRAEIESKLVKTPLLILDDFTAGDATAGWIERMELVIDQRTQNRRPMIIAAHSTVDAIGAMFQKAVASRLKYFTVLTVLGGDRRSNDNSQR